MKNVEIARQFDLMADVLEIQGENPFRVRAYRRAAQSLTALGHDVEALAREGRLDAHPRRGRARGRSAVAGRRAARLDAIPGVGKDLAGKIEEYLRTGRIRDVEAARRRVPGGVVQLMGLPGIGPKTARRLHERGVTTPAELERRAAAGKLRGLPGIQAKTEEKILAGLRLARRDAGRMLLGRALAIGRELAGQLEGVAGVERVALAGSLRRMRETVGDIDVLVTSTRPAEVMKAFAALPQAAQILERGTTRAAIRHRDGLRVDLRVVEPACFGAALVYFTGSKQHNIRIREMAARRGLKISEYGVFRAPTGRRVAAATEEDVYAALGLPWIPPELREDTGEIEAAAARRLPALVTLADVRGDLHCHTKATDGQHSIDEMVAAAAARGYRYVAITDHSVSTRVAGGLGAAELVAHVAKIRAVQRRFPRIAVLAASECDIGPDGALDYPDEVLAQLDLVVGAVHARLRQPRAEMTRRVCRALASPYLDVLAHPTGRLLGQREPSELDLDAVLGAAAQHGKALEINAQPDRLDLCDAHARQAAARGALVAIDTDAHLVDSLASIELGVGTARRGWVDAAHVVNTWPLRKLLAWARAHRRPARRPR